MFWQILINWKHSAQIPPHNYRKTGYLWDGWSWICADRGMEDQKAWVPYTAMAFSSSHGFCGWTRYWVLVNFPIKEGTAFLLAYKAFVIS